MMALGRPGQFVDQLKAFTTSNAFSADCHGSYLGNCPGFPFSFLIRIGWGEKFIMRMSLKFKLMIMVSEKVVLGISSFFIESMCQWIGVKLVWAISYFIVFACLARTAIISLVSVREYSKGIQHVIGGNGVTKIASLVVFALLGFLFLVPLSVTVELTADTGGGQGLAIGVLNLAIVIPQMIVSLGVGPWDALFGGGNIPAFVLASLCAFAAGVIATIKLPNLSSNSFKSSSFHFG
ncbi:sucrose transporter 2 [Actinidia rufa]|uniref:Sucrose transporter 2 n=1 Tax=Actinidia rufa TaxID=165716 RepID=A0A7J0HEQ9_9ERIC|nr:sucrose transporter 2 [Actinidia rufa]